MRVALGIVGLLIALAIVGIGAKKQLQATGQTVSGIAPAASGANVAEQSRQAQQQVKTDVTKALEQGAAARGAGAEK